MFCFKNYYTLETFTYLHRYPSTWISGYSSSFPFRLGPHLVIHLSWNTASFSTKTFCSVSTTEKFNVAATLFTFCLRSADSKPKSCAFFRSDGNALFAVVRPGIVSFKTCNKEEMGNTSVLYLKSLSIQVLHTKALWHI